MGLITFLTSATTVRLRRRTPATGPSRQAPPVLRESMWLTLASHDAPRLRRLLSAREGCRIECCIPWPADGRVQLRISHPAGQAPALRRWLAPHIPSCAWPPCGSPGDARFL